MPSYPLSFPAGLAPARATFRLSRSQAVAVSPFTFSRQVQSWGGRRWEAEITMPPLGNRAKAAALKAWLVSLRGLQGTFLLGEPGYPGPRGTATAAVVNGAGQAGYTLAVAGMAAGATLLAGDYVELPGHRLHMVVEDAAANGAGAAVLSLDPPLRASPADGAALILMAPRGVWSLASPSVAWDLSPPYRHEFTFAAVEEL